MKQLLLSTQPVTRHSFWAPFWPPRHTGCIIKWVPAGVRCPGERGENEACWMERRTTLPIRLPSPPVSPPCCHCRPTLLACQVMMRELWELLCRIRHTGERHWQPHKERHTAYWKSPAKPSRVWRLETYTAFGDVWMNHVCANSITSWHVVMHIHVRKNSTNSCSKSSRRQITCYA